MFIYKDLILGSLLIIINIMGSKGLQRIDIFTPDHSSTVMLGLGPTFFPSILLNLLGIIGGIIILKNLFNLFKLIKNKSKRKKFKISIYNWRKPQIPFNIILYFLSVVVYETLLPIFGFLLTTYLFLCIYVIRFYFLFNDQKTITAIKGHLYQLFARIIIINMGITFIVYFVFSFIAKVPLPKGIFGD